MRKIHATGLLLMIVAVASGCAGTPARVENSEDSAISRFTADVVEDHRRHYSADTLLDLLPPLAVAGTLANTNADRWIRDTWQQDVRSDTSDDLARVFLRVGDVGQNRISAPLYLLTMAASDYGGDAANDSPAATWAARSLRANILGGPQAFALTYLLGSHRPDVGSSAWNPWNDNDGTSGHSFYGAVPLLTAARMSESLGWRYTFYALSVLPAYARINDNQHYTSQAVMGWSLAWLATRTVAETDSEPGSNGDSFSVTPILTPDGGYVMLHWRF